MTRIIAGLAGSLRLDVPPRGTRPTSDRVRESIFGALDAAGTVDGAAVLDLYAGSGALGLEAASRGARIVDLVEQAPKAAVICTANAAHVSKALRGEGSGSARVRVHRASVDAFLSARAATGHDYDLVLADPPYDLGETELTTMLALLVPLLNPDATVIVERGRHSPEPSWPEALRASTNKRYGDTAVWWSRLVAPVDGVASVDE